MSAPELAERLQDMVLLTVATVTADGRPLAGPVDGIFSRGAVHFGSSPTSGRMHHIRQPPAVSATHLRAESFAVTVHGQAAVVDHRAAEGADLRRTLLDIYVPRSGPQWEGFLDGGPMYARTDADRVFTFAM